MTNKAIPGTPFDPDRYLGTVTQVTPESIGANMPFAASGQSQREALRGGVGEFVFIECENLAVFGRIIEVRVPDRERLSIEPEYGKSVSVSPLGIIRMLASIDLVHQRVSRGVGTYPKIGDRIYGSSPELISLLAADDRDLALRLNLGHLSSGERGVAVEISPERLLGRHCGVLGTTGGGKSWTVARLVEEIKALGGKAILFDATGEFRDNTCIDQNTALGTKALNGETNVSFSYREMTESDIFTLFNPSGGVQGPKLRDAIKSLKLVEAMGESVEAGVFVENGNIVKEHKGKGAYFRAIETHRAFVDTPYCTFDMRRLISQIEHECANAHNQQTPTSWGPISDRDRSYCSTLTGRIAQIITSPELSCVFKPSAASLTKKIEAFVDAPQKNILRVSMEYLSFQHNARELIANAVGRYLLDKARSDLFRATPLIIILDEAHQFLNKSVGDEFSLQTLDAFGLIAKEGRKYGLTCVLSTQRPRDIPEDVLSQLGTLVVHRLINDGDRRVVERACGELDRSATAFLPTLDQGEALLVGADFSIPIPLRIRAPMSPPNSTGPTFQNSWKGRSKT